MINTVLSSCITMNLLESFTNVSIHMSLSLMVLKNNMMGLLLLLTFSRLLINLIKSTVIVMDSHSLRIMFSCPLETKLNIWKCSNSLINILLKTWLSLALTSTLWNSYNLSATISQMSTWKLLMSKEKTNFLRFMVNNLPKRFFLNIQKETCNSIWKSTHKWSPQIEFKEMRLNHKILNSKTKNTLIKKFMILFQSQSDQKAMKHC